jgi:hypothetical protein
MNLINIFARGNQELFHSAFLAWLMDRSAEHGLGTQFVQAMLTRSGLASLYKSDCDFDPLTEHSAGRLRFDILLRPRGPCNGRAGVVFENKVKSFGLHSQLQNYREAGYDVVALALLPETLDDDSKRAFPLVPYSEIRDILKGLALEDGNPYHFIIREYWSHLDATLTTYDALRMYCMAEISWATFKKQLSSALVDVTLRDNDIRTFTFFYYENFRRYLADYAPELVFGCLGYEEAKQQNSNTQWICQKNMQGPPFMESLIYGPFGPAGRFRMHQDFGGLYHQQPFEIAPRIELWLDLKRMTHAQDDSESAGSIMLGFWQEGIIQMLRGMSALNCLGNRRNLHVEEVPARDIPFARMADRLRNMLRLLGYFLPSGEGPTRA